MNALKESPNSVLTIHYSCESFYDRPNGSSPRITSIAVRNWGSGQTYSFSIHQQAERDQKSIEDLETEYDTFEKQMLGEFYQFGVPIATEQFFTLIPIRLSKWPQTLPFELFVNVETDPSMHIYAAEVGWPLV